MDFHDYAKGTNLTHEIFKDPGNHKRRKWYKTLSTEDYKITFFFRLENNIPITFLVSF